MSAAISAVQAAVYNRLANASAVSALVGARIYDTVPGEATFPYIAAQPIVSVPYDTMQGVGQEIAFQVSAWTRSDGAKSAEDIAAAIYDALHRVSLTVSGFSFVNCLHEQTQVIRETGSDDRTWAAILRFRIVVQA